MDEQSKDAVEDEHARPPRLAAELPPEIMVQHWNQRLEATSDPAEIEHLKRLLDSVETDLNDE